MQLIVFVLYKHMRKARENDQMIVLPQPNTVLLLFLQSPLLH